MKKLFFSLGLWSALAWQAYAQERVLEEVSVTATKFPKRASETGKVISVIGPEELARSAGKSIAELLNGQSALYLNGANSSRGSNISTFMRGAATGYTLILLDGIPLNDPSQISNDYDLNLIPISMIERIEVLRGGHSTLYGSDAVAGVINIISKKGGERLIGLNATVAAGTYGAYKQSIGLNGTKNRLDYNLSLSRETVKGFSNATDETGTGDFDRDPFKNEALAFSLGIHASQHLLIRPFLRYAKSGMSLDYGPFTDDADYIGHSSDLSTGLSAEWNLTKADVYFNYGSSLVKRYFENDSLSGPSAYMLSDTRARSHNAELYAKMKLADRIDLLAGTAFRSANTDQEVVYIPNWGPTPGIARDTARTTIGSLYASVFLNNWKGFNMEVGGRWSRHNVYGNNFTYTINPSYLIEGRTKVFVNLSSAFKVPTLYQLYSEFGNTELKPESITTMEAGFQTGFGMGQNSLRLSAFKRDGKEVIAFGPKNRYLNYNQQHDTGMELEAQLDLGREILLKTWYALVYGEISTPTDTFNNLYRRPRNSAGLSLNYRVNEQLFLSADTRWIGMRIDPYFDPNTFSTTLISLKDYALLNLYGEYRFTSKLKIFIDLKNLTNEQYTELTGFNVSGRNLTAGLSLSL